MRKHKLLLKMTTLTEDLQSIKTNLQEFHDLTVRITVYRNDTVSNKYVDHRGYRIQYSISGDTKKYLRPVKIYLFIWDVDEFRNKFLEFKQLLIRLREGERVFKEQAHNIIDSVVYTMQQSIGLGLDLLSNPNSARKHVGNRFEELLRIVISEIGLRNQKMIFNVPYVADGKAQKYKSETDIIVSPYEKIKSNTNSLDLNELIISVKTTSKDRMGKMFLDKLLLKEMFNLDNVKVVGIFLNDVQRKKGAKTSFTFVPGQFIVYSKYIESMEGVYYLDTPESIQNKSPFKEMIRPFSEFLTADIWSLLRT
jgi:hypothetical protein